MKNLFLGAATILGVYFIWKIGNGKTFTEAVNDLKNINGGSYVPPIKVETPTKKYDTKGVVAVNNLGYNEMPYVMNVSPDILQDYTIDPFEIFTDNKVLTIES